MTLGQRISLYRKKLNISQEELGARLGVSRQAVSKWETDLSAPDLNNLIGLARELGVSVAEVPGSGAAGAFGAGILAFLKGKLCPGIEAVLDLVKFDEKLTDCDLVLTGEGRFDSQSIRGKVISGVSKRAREKNVPVVVVAGSVDKEMESVSADPASGIAAVFSINRQAMDYSESKPFSRVNYQYTLENVLRTLRAAEHFR